jgi:hypothetical protein
MWWNRAYRPPVTVPYVGKSTPLQVYASGSRPTPLSPEKTEADYFLRLDTREGLPMVRTKIYWIESAKRGLRIECFFDSARSPGFHMHNHRTNRQPNLLETAGSINLPKWLQIRTPVRYYARPTDADGILWMDFLPKTKDSLNFGSLEIRLTKRMTLSLSDKICTANGRDGYTTLSAIPYADCRQRGYGRRKCKQWQAGKRRAERKISVCTPRIKLSRALTRTSPKFRMKLKGVGTPDAAFP